MTSEVQPPGGLSIVMVRPHLRDIPDFQLPPGFSIRPLHPHEAALWVDIERDAEPFVPIPEDLFVREFGIDPAVVAERCFVVIGPEDQAVATISAWFNRDFRGGDWGRIHWVATRRTYQKAGIGRGMLTFALRRLAQWHDRAYLVTSSERLPAIKVYLAFGFLPDLDEPDALRAWREVAARLVHPALALLRA